MGVWNFDVISGAPALCPYFTRTSSQLVRPRCAGDTSLEFAVELLVSAGIVDDPQLTAQIVQMPLSPGVQLPEYPRGTQGT